MLTLGEHFGPRRAEWVAAAQSMVWGFVLLGPSDTFSSSPAFALFRQYISEDVFGWLMMTVGIVRMISLVINGRRKKTTSWMRFAAAFVGCGIFMFISLAFAASGVWSTWLAAWPFVALNEFFNIDAAVRDARVAHGRRSTDR